MLIPQDSRTAMQRALLYQFSLAMTLGAGLLSIIGLVILLTTPGRETVFYVLLMSMLALLMWVGLLATKLGHAAELSLLVGLPLIASTVTGLLVAHSANIASFSYAITLVLAAVTLRPRQVLMIFALCLVLSGGLFAMELQGYVGPIVAGNQLYLGGALTTLLTLGLVTLCSVRGQQTLRQNQAAAEEHAHHLEQLYQNLREQNHELEVEQNALAQRYTTLLQKLTTVGELGIGVIPLAPGAFIVPLHGDITLDAAHAVRARLLAAYAMQEAHTLVLDVQCSICRPAAARVLAMTLESIAALNVRVLVCGSSHLLAPLAPTVQRLPRLSDVLKKLA